jgi:Bacterial protein of unknown function (DUF885)
MNVIKEIEDLGRDFWQWRMLQQPRSHDDIPRLERPRNWRPAWSQADVLGYRKVISEFEHRWSGINVGSANAPDVNKEDWVDYQLIGSAISRVIWELDYLKTWQEQPRFYIDQTIGVVFDLLLPLKISADHVGQTIFAFGGTRQILEDGIVNLDGHAVGPHAKVAIELLEDIENQISELVLHLGKFADSTQIDILENSAADATKAFVAYREKLRSDLATMKPIVAIGAAKYQWFFENVALVPFSADELRLIGQLEWDRAVTLEHISLNKHRNVPVPPIPATATEQIANEAKSETQVRDFYETENILSQPKSLKHYLTAALPDYLAPLKWLGVTDDLTGPSRVDENGYSYVPKPHDQLPYFYIANARDTRAGIVHEGAHYQQLAISWRHKRPLRRSYYDSGVNEGIAFYNEEMLLAAGLFDDAVHSQSVMYNFMKLRAMRVIVDVGLATGEIDMPTATLYLERKVPMDHGTAYEEAVSFSSNPGQALTYQIGKTQIIKLFSDAIEMQRTQATNFSMREFHDYVWLNGNVPLSLQRYEYLDDSSEIVHIQQSRDKNRERGANGRG